MKKLCLDNEYLNEFKTDIVKCDRNEDSTFSVILGDSYFYPESGGQTGDQGQIGDANVIDVVTKNGEIVHITDKAVKGKNVNCAIDWRKRFDHMQQHTGQHMLSGVIEDKYGIKTLSFHMGEEDSSIETDVKNITEDRIDEIEMLVNDAIFRNIEVKKYFTEGEVEGVRKKVNINGPKRVVAIDGVDISYCGGTHVNRTGEIGIFKITGIDKVRKNIRLHFKCGYRALNDYRKNFTVVSKLKKVLTMNEDSIIEGVEILIEREKELKRQIKKYKLKELDDFAENVKENIYKDELKGYKDEEIRYIQSRLIGKGVESIIRNSDTNRIFIAVKQDKNDKFKALLDEIKREFDIKGGGNKGKFQLIPNEKREEIWAKLTNLLK
ncbi:MAG: hypothetical protein GWP03_06420 [Proteobacteria bacterium]|nr:hypothetical protein [Pseudomonadota bacterium]